MLQNGQSADCRVVGLKVSFSPFRLLLPCNFSVILLSDMCNRNIVKYKNPALLS